MTDEKSMIVIIACIDRRLNEMIDKMTEDAQKKGYEVVVFRTPGGDVDLIKDELRELLATKKVKAMENIVGIPHHDCGWVKTCAEILYDNRKFSDEFTKSVRQAFEGFEPSEQVRANRSLLLTEMELFHMRRTKSKLEKLAEEHIQEPADRKTEIRMLMPHAKSLEGEKSGEQHTHELVMAEPSAIKCERMAAEAESKTESTYIVQCMSAIVRRIAAELAIVAMKIEDVTILAPKDKIGKAEGEKIGLLTHLKESSVNTDYVNVSVKELSERTKLRT
jgi:carbonic anhydrase